MKQIITVFMLVYLSAYSTATLQAQQLVKLWETDSTFKVPESSLYSPSENIIYVSNIDGQSNEKDLKGSISKLGVDGKVVQHNWAINLSAPKGMGIHDKRLYVADLDEVVILELASGKVLQRIPVEGAVFLNDITIHTDGTLYVSDTRKGIIHQVKNSVVSSWLENKVGVNGLLLSGDDLYFVAKDTLFKMGPDKQPVMVTDGMDTSSDGIVELANKDLVVSCWSGIIYYVHKDGSRKILLDLRPQKINTADIGLDAEKNILYVPTFFKNKVMAFQVKL